MIDSILPRNLEARKQFIRTGSKYGTVAMLILYFILLFQFNQKDESSLSNTKMILYVIALVVPLVIFSYFVLSNVEDKKYLGLVILMILVILFTLLGTALPSFADTVNRFIGYLTDYADLPPLPPVSGFIVTFASKLLLVSIIVIALALIFNIFINESMRLDGILGIITNAIFLIPCLVNDYVRYLLREVVSTPNVVYALLFIELILILAYVFLPKIVKKVAMKYNTYLIKDPIYLYDERVISDNSPFVPDKNNMKLPYDGTSASPLIRNYSISMWISTNYPTYGKNQEQCIFRYGTSTKPTVGCPYIGCKGDGKWRFVLSNVGEKPPSLELHVPMQRWNNVVFNYHDNQVDIFINGKLESTLSLANNLPVYETTSNITIGGKNNTLHGAICNLNVSQVSMNATHIAQQYNLLKLVNPPVNNIL